MRAPVEPAGGGGLVRRGRAAVRESLQPPPQSIFIDRVRRRKTNDILSEEVSICSGALAGGV